MTLDSNASILILLLLLAFIAGHATAGALARRRARLDGQVLLFLGMHPGAYALDLVHAKVVGRGYARLRRLEDEGRLVSKDEPVTAERAERGFLPRRRYWLAPVRGETLDSAVAS